LVNCFKHWFKWIDQVKEAAKAFGMMNQIIHLHPLWVNSSQLLLTACDLTANYLTKINKQAKF
jgi:hypothetical protein